MSSDVGKRKDTPESVQFWHFAEQACQRVALWPGWKRGEPASDDELPERGGEDDE